jgi:hypothetical protein
MARVCGTRMWFVLRAASVRTTPDSLQLYSKACSASLSFPCQVSYYTWKLERRYERSISYKGWALCHDAIVWGAVLWQLLRLAHLAQVLLGGSQ